MILLRNVSKTYHTGNSESVVAINDVSIELPSQGLVSIIGESGSGKTTLLNILSGLDAPDNGRVVAQFGETNIELSSATEDEMEVFRNLFMGYVFQDYNLLDDFNVNDNVGIVIEQQERLDYEGGALTERIRDALETVGLPECGARRITELSGGQQQRIAIARCIVKKPKVIFADEPTGNLDSENAEKIMGLFRKISVECLVVIVTHNNTLAKKYSNRIIKLADGAIVEDLEIEPCNNGVENGNQSVKEKPLPLKTLLRLTKDSLKVRKARLIVFSLLFCILSFGVFSISLFVNRSVARTICTFASDEGITRWRPYIEESITTPNGYSAILQVGRSDSLMSVLNRCFAPETIKFARNNAKILEGNKKIWLDYSIVEDNSLGNGTLLYGRLPMDEAEVAVPELFCNEYGLGSNAVGKTITIDEVPLTICGVIKSDIRDYSESSSFDKQISHRFLVSKGFLNYIERNADVIWLPYSSVGLWSFSLDKKSQASFAAIDEQMKPEYLSEGAMPDNTKDIIVSENYAIVNDFSVDDFDGLTTLGGGFTDLSKLSGNMFTNTINLHEILPEIHVAGIVFDVFARADVSLDSSLFLKLKSEYFSRCYYDSVELATDNGITEKQVNCLLESGILLDNQEVQSIIDADNMLKNLDAVFLPALLLIFSALFFALCLFFSCNIKDNESKIGVMRALGVRKKDVRKMFALEAYMIGGVMSVLGCLLALMAIAVINRRMHLKGCVATSQISISFVTCVIVFVVIFVTTVLTVWVPLHLFLKKRPIDLIRRK